MMKILGLAMSDITRSDVEQKVIHAICSDMGIPAEKVSVSSRLYDDLSMDSLETANLILGLESQFGVELIDINIMSNATVQVIVDALLDKLKIVN